MNLIVDIRNSRTRFSVFNRGEILITVPVNEFDPEHLDVIFEEHPDLENVIVLSEEELQENLRAAFSERFKSFIEFNESTPLPVEIAFNTGEYFRKDRVAAITGINELFPDTNILLIEAGKTILYDFVDEENKYLGGSISPGLEMRFRSLHQFTAHLPLVEPFDFNKLIGATIEESILAGVQNGIVYEIESVINTFKDFYDNLKVIITGRGAAFFDKKLKNSFFVHYNLTAIGLNRILEYNVNK